MKYIIISISFWLKFEKGTQNFFKDLSSISINLKINLIYIINILFFKNNVSNINYFLTIIFTCQISNKAFIYLYLLKTSFLRLFYISNLLKIRKILSK